MPLTPLDANAPITQAVIAVAGSGTRFLPATKAIPKEMIPIIDRPIVQYVVEELADAGIKDVIFVSRWDKKVLEDHFDHHPTLEDDLRVGGKEKYLAATRKPAEIINAVYIRQKGPYGNGTPALNGGRLVSDPVFVYAFGDDLVSADVSFTAQLIAQYRKTPGLILGVQEVPESEVPKYGMVEIDAGMAVKRIVEKPAPSEVTSNLVGFGRFILPADIVTILKETPRGKGNELWLMDAVQEYVKRGGAVYACRVKDGRWLTTGDPESYFDAFMHYALRHEDLKGHVRATILRLADELKRNSTDR